MSDATKTTKNDNEQPDAVETTMPEEDSPAINLSVAEGEKNNAGASVVAAIVTDRAENDQSRKR